MQKMAKICYEKSQYFFRLGMMIGRVAEWGLLLPFFLLSCTFGWTAAGASVTVQNQTDKSIVVCDFSPLENPPAFPVEIAAHEKHVFKSGRLSEQYTFTVEVDGKRYESETDYVQDWRRFSIVFAPSDESGQGIVCTIDKDGRKLVLKEDAGKEGA